MTTFIFLLLILHLIDLLLSYFIVYYMPKGRRLGEAGSLTTTNCLFLFHILLFSYALFIIFLIYLFRCSPVVLELSIFGKFFYFVYVLPSYSYPAGVLSLMFPFLTHVFHEILVSFSVHIFFLYFLFLLKFGHLIPVSQSNILSYRHSSI